MTEEQTLTAREIRVTASQATSSLVVHPHRDVDDDDQVFSVVCYRQTILRTALVIIGAILTIGLLGLICLWSVKFRAWVLCRKCEEAVATHFLVTSPHSSELLRPRWRASIERGQVRAFTYRHLHYYVENGEVRPLIFTTSRTYSAFHQEFGRGYTDDAKVQELRMMYGSCKINIPEPGICTLLVYEILTPFVIFQAYSIGLWCYEDYYWYAIAIFILTTISVVTNLIDIKQNIHRVRFLAGETFQVNVIRSGQKVALDSGELVHGDLVIIPLHGPIPCDLVLISGGCIMKESMLTGESVPMIKDPLPEREDFVYDIEKDKLYTLYQGTEVLQASVNKEGADVLGVVTRTGFHTLKGKLIRSILFPKPNRFQFAREAMLFISLLAFMAIVGFFILLKPMLDTELVAEDVALRILDLLTISVPPLLPTAMTVGTVFAIIRLKSSSIFCISPPRVNVAGEVKLMVFDKTGTLTQDGMTLMGVIPADGTFETLIQTNDIAESAKLFMENLVSCHSLKMVGTTMIGDIMDIVIFSSTGWTFNDSQAEDTRALITSPDGKTTLKLVHLFHFDSTTKRMGVIIKGNDFSRFHVKGAPEVISALCDPATVPSNLGSMLEIYAQTGLRVLACASGPVAPYESSAVFKTMNINDMEHNLTFLGIMVLQNQLKPESPGAIKILQDADIRCIMATGDASLTGLAIGRECGIVPTTDEVYVGDVDGESVQWQRFTFENGKKDNADNLDDKSRFTDVMGVSTVTPITSMKVDRGITETTWISRLLTPGFSLVITGKLFSLLSKKAESGNKQDKVLLRGCLEHAKVYARMSPEQKTLLVEHLKATNVLVGMCGDGANDCGALKAADIGISLSEAEASIAAPFTSKIQNISAVITVLREGRCALATSFMSFKYMALYAMIQFSSGCIMSWWGVYLSDKQFLFEDIFVVLPLTMFMSYTNAHSQLSKRTPGDSLLTFPVLLSVIGHGLLCFASQVLAWGLVSREDFFYTVDINSDLTDGFNCWENDVIWLTANINYLTTVLLFSIGRPFRKEPYTNWAFSIWWLWLLAVSLCLMLDPQLWVRDFLDLMDLERTFKLKLLGINVAYVVSAVLFEKVIVWLVDWDFRKRKAQRARKELLQELSMD